MTSEWTALVGARLEDDDAIFKLGDDQLQIMAFTVYTAGVLVVGIQVCTFMEFHWSWVAIDGGDMIADCAHLKYGSTCCCSPRGPTLRSTTMSLSSLRRTALFARLAQGVSNARGGTRGR